MLRDSVATESIYGFALEQAEVSPKEPIFVLTSSQLQEIIKRAVQDATEPLYKELAYDRQRIAKLEQREPGPHTKDRVDILRALLAANNGKMLEKDARQKMHLSRSQFSKLLDHAQEHVAVKPYHLRRNQKILVQVVSGNKKPD